MPVMVSLQPILAARFDSTPGAGRSSSVVCTRYVGCILVRRTWELRLNVVTLLPLLPLLPLLLLLLCHPFPSPLLVHVLATGPQTVKPFVSELLFDMILHDAIHKLVYSYHHYFSIINT